MNGAVPRDLRGLRYAVLATLVVACCLAERSAAQQVALAPPIPVLQSTASERSDATPATENDFDSLVQRLAELEAQVEEELAAAKKQLKIKSRKRKAGSRSTRSMAIRSCESMKRSTIEGQHRRSTMATVRSETIRAFCSDGRGWCYQVT